MPPALPPNYDNPLRVTLVVGQGYSGKTTLGLTYLREVTFACRFIFDVNGQLSARLNQPRVGTARQCEEALASRYVCFNPLVGWDADRLLEAFNWFCHWALECSKRSRGRKVVFVDDSWEFTPARTMTKQLARVVRIGRFWELEYFGLTHRPKDYHIDIRALVTEWIAFNLVEPKDHEAVSPYWPGISKAATLPPRHCIGYNRNTTAELYLAPDGQGGWNETERG